MATSPVLYVYYPPLNDDAYPGVPNRHITEADWASFTIAQRRTIENATTQEGYTRRKVWVHRDLVDETEEERAQREAEEAAARAEYDRKNSLVRYGQIETMIDQLEVLPPAEEFAALRQDVDAVADVPPRVEAVETALTGKADIAAVQAVEAAISAFTTDTAHPTLQAALNAGAGGTVIVSRSQTVPVGTVIPSKTRVLVSPGVVLTRPQPSTGDWITVGEGAILDGGEYNGNKASATSFSKNYRAINVLAGGTLQNAYVHDNNGHGVRLDQNARALRVRSDNHGNAPGPSGSGDGIYIADVLGAVVDGCTTDGNARMGVTVTSNTLPASATVLNTHAGTGNAYNAYDFERAPGGNTVTVHAQRITGGSLPCSGATVVLEDASLTRIASSTTMAAQTDVTLRRVRLTPAANESAAEVYANRIVLDDVKATVSMTAGWGMAFYPASVGYAQDVILTGSVYQGTLFSVSGTGRWERIVNSYADVTFTNRRLGVRTVAGGSLRFAGSVNGRFDVTEGRWRGYAPSAPSNSTWTNGFDVGDIVINNAPTAGAAMGWVCVTAGTPGTWKAYGSIDV